MEPSAAASQQALENGLTMESSSAGENGRERTESEATLLARASTDISGTLQPLMPSAKTENVNKSAADIWDEQAAELLPGAEAIGRDNRGALHHVGLGAQEGGETKVQQKEETPKAEQKSRSQEILIRSLQANKPLIAIPGVPEARDRNGQPLPPPTLPSSIRPCVDGEHLKEAKAPEEPHKDVLGTIGSNELLFAACVLGLGCAGYLLGSLGASMIWIPITAVIGALAIRNWRAKEEKKAHFEHHMIEGALALGSNIETAEWANFLIAQIWNILDPDMFTALLDQIEDQSNLLAKDMLKGLAFHISVRDFELGPHPPRITAIQVFPAASGEDSILMDMSISMSAPPQLNNPDMTKLGLHMVVSMDVGSEKVGSVTVPTLVEVSEMQLRARIQITLSSAPPFAKELRVSLLSEPVIGISIKPLKMVNVMNLPVLDSFILTSITSAINELCLAPRVLRIDLESLLTGQEIASDTNSLGVVKVILHESVGTRKADVFSESDQYCMVSVESTSRPVARTRVVSDDPRPVWEDTHYALVNEDHVRNDSRVTLTIWDWDSKKPDEFLGKVQFSVRELLDHAGPFFRGWKRLESEDGTEPAQGWLNCEIGFYPKVDREQQPIESTVDVGDEARKVEELPGPDFIAGILGIYIHQGAEIAVRKKDAITDYVSAYATIYLNDVATFKTRTKSHNPAPYWNTLVERFVPDYQNAVVRIVVKDERPREWDPVIGVVVVKIGELLDTMKGKRTDARWHALEGGIGFGKLRLSFNFRTVNMIEPPNVQGFDVGTIVLGHFEARNLDKLPGAGRTPSPFLDARFSLAADTEWTRKTTPVVRKCKDPVWPEEVMVPFRTLHKNAGVITLYVKDHRKGAVTAKTIGSASFFAQDVIEVKPEYFEVELLEPLIHI